MWRSADEVERREDRLLRSNDTGIERGSEGGVEGFTVTYHDNSIASIRTEGEVVESVEKVPLSSDIQELAEERFNG